MALHIKELFADVLSPVDDVDFLFKTSSTGGAKGLYQRISGAWVFITGSGTFDASVVTFTPAVNADWAGNSDPGNTDDALDQLAERVKDLEIGSLTDASIVTYVPGEDNDWQSNTDPGNVDDALDQLAERTRVLETASGIGEERGSEWSVLAASGELIFDSNGDVIMTELLR